MSHSNTEPIPTPRKSPRDRRWKQPTYNQELAKRTAAAAAAAAATRKPKRQAETPEEASQTPEEASQTQRILRQRRQLLSPYSTLSGEFYDISIPTYSNKFGEKYITCIWENGIDIPITKYIEELQDILNNKADDKSEKRKERLKFLLFCNEFKILQEIFKLFTNLLNGGGSNEEQTTLYETFPDPTSSEAKEKCNFNQYNQNQKLVLTTAGGNVMIIFAQFLHIILTTEEYSDIGEINKFILKHYDTSEPKSGKPIFNTIKREINEKEAVSLIIVEDTIEINKDEFEGIVKDIAEKSYSDFDFKITPNMNSSINEAFIEEFNEKAKDKESEGFLLFRCKTAMDCMSNKKKEIDKDNTKIACDEAKKSNKDLLKKQLGVTTLPESEQVENILLAPQTIQKNFFDEEWLKNHFILPKNLDAQYESMVSTLLRDFGNLFDKNNSFENKFIELKKKISAIKILNGDKNIKNFLGCFTYLMTLYEKKLNIGVQTQINVNAILSNFGGIPDLSSEDSVKIKYEIIIKYLYGISKTLNKYIEVNIEKLKLNIDSINRSYLNIRTLLLKDEKPNDLTSFIAEVFEYLVTNDKTFQNKNIIKKLTKCYIPEPCKYLRPANPRIYSYLSTKNKVLSPEEQEERDSLQKLYNMLYVNITDYDPPNIPPGLRLIINVIKQTSRQLTPIDKKELDSFIEDHVFKDEQGNPIDLKLGDYTDEELLTGVPDDAIEKYAAGLGFECLPDEELDKLDLEKLGAEEEEEIEVEDEPIDDDAEMEEGANGGGSNIQEEKRQKKTVGKKTKKKFKKRKKTKKSIRKKNKKTKKFKNIKKNLKKSKKHKNYKSKKHL